MSTPKDAERTAAIRAWFDHIANGNDPIAVAHASTGIAHRKLQRMRSGKVPPPPRLLENVASYVDDPELAERLRAAARPAEESANA